MMFKSLKFIIASLSIIFAVSLVATAQNVAISVEKRQLIDEFVAITKAKELTKQITESSLKAVEANYPEIISKIISERKDLTPRQKTQLKQSLRNGFGGFTSKFKERYWEAVNLDKFFKEEIYPIYDKYFSEKELSDLVEFYKTDTGRKVIDVMPKLTADSMDRTQKVLSPLLVNLINEILDEELKGISPAATSRKP